ncbi:MAG: hypothetical protein FD125_711 [bacterium]|nr:MAG: hypothetical protein FD125_711 [bacterium]
MIRGYALVLGLLVIASALFAGWYGSTRVVYFAPALFEQSIECGFEEGDREPVLDSFEADWYGEALRGFDEPSLYRASLVPEASGRTLRFTWLRSFHDPIFVRIDWFADGGAQLTAGQRAKGRREGSQTRRVSRRLTPDELQELDAVLIRSALADQPPKFCDVGTDGARWIIESVEPSTGYIYVNRWTPEDGPVRDIGLHMVGLTGWQIARVY